MGAPSYNAKPASPVVDESQAVDPALEAEVKAAAESETAETEAQADGGQAE